MSLTGAELGDVVAELRSLLPGGRLDKLNAPDENSCQLVLRARGENHVLLIGLVPGATRVHLLSARRPGLAEPPGWVLACRRKLAGAVLHAVLHRADDRVVRLVFEHGKRPRRVLVACLFDRVGRLFLLDEHETVLQAPFGGGRRGEPLALPAPPEPAKRTRSRFSAADPHTLAANRAVEAHYARALERQEIDRLRRAVARRAGRERKRLSRRCGKMQADLDRTAAAGELAHQAEVLKVHLHRVARGTAAITLPDPYDQQGGAIELQLDPALGPVENMQRLFDRSRRLAAARPAIDERLGAARAELEAVEALQLEAQAADDPATLEALLQRLGGAAPAAPAKKKPARRLAYKSYRSAAGHQILVGRSGADNHALTFRVARGHDLWLHARNRPGAHVIVRLGRKEAADEQTLLDAATLAALAAGAGPGDKVEISHTRAKNVHPLKGAAPGRVSVAGARTLLVRVEAARIERLKASIDQPS